MKKFLVDSTQVLTGGFTQAPGQTLIRVPESGADLDISPLELSGQSPIINGYTQPLTDEIHVYVMSEVHVQFPDAQPCIGDDSSDGLSKDSPLRTMDGVRKMIARRGIAGKRIIIHLAGGGYPAVADPWDGQPTSPRYYLVRDLFIGGSEAFEQSWSVRGPRKMVIVSTPVISTFGPDGLRTKWTTTADLGAANSLRGLWIRITRGVNGYEVTQPVQITGNSGVFFWTDNGPNTPGSVYETTDTYNIVSCAAELVSTNSIEGDVGAADGVAAQGFGASDIHSRPSAGGNPTLTFERVAFERFNSSGVAGLSFATCLFYNTTTFRGGWAEFNGCIVNSADGFAWLAGTRGNGNSSEQNEFNGRAIIPAEAPYPDTDADPMWPERGGIGLYVAQGGMRIGDVHDRGIWRIWKSLSVEGPLVVYGVGSALVQPVNINVLFIRYADGVGLHCRNGGVAIIDDANNLVEIAAINASSALKVGIGAAIALGDGAGAFREVGVWAGNFSRHLEVNAGGKPTGDSSRIADSTTWF